MQYSDGKNDLKSISKFIKLPFSQTKKLFNLLEIGVEIVGVIRVAIILVKKDLNGN